jgi:hypothetical protein
MLYNITETAEPDLESTHRKKQAHVRAYGTGQSLRGLRPRSQGVAEQLLTNSD